MNEPFLSLQEMSGMKSARILCPKKHRREGLALPGGVM